MGPGSKGEVVLFAGEKALIAIDSSSGVDI